MGRRKKFVELEEVGKIDTEKILIEDLKKKETLLDRNKKKWENLIMRTYKQQLIIDQHKLYRKLQEKFSCDEEVKNIISELKIKIKDLEYMNKKQWQILKKFNLQEKIYREEVKLLNESDKMKKDEIYKEAIEKFTAAHIGGFEPEIILKNKIIIKVQQKFEISDDIINELRKLNYDSEINHKKNSAKIFTNPIEISEENLLLKRYEDQIEVLEKFIKENFLNPRVKDRDREYESTHNFLQNKQELKRYEKEIEMKAGKYIINNDEDKFVLNYDSNIESVSNKITVVEKSSKSIFDLQSNMLSNNTNFVEKYENDQIEFDFNHNDVDMSDDFLQIKKKFDESIKLKDILKVSDAESIMKFREKVIIEIKEKANYNKDICEISLNSIYKSKILNDLYIKLTSFGKLTDFDIQILIFLSHVVVRDLVQAKISNKIYEGLICPDEMLDFLKRFKIEIQNSGNILIDGKTIASTHSDNNLGNLNTNFNVKNNNGNNSSYSYVFSEHSKEEY